MKSEFINIGERRLLELERKGAGGFHTIFAVCRYTGDGIVNWAIEEPPKYDEDGYLILDKYKIVAVHKLPKRAVLHDGSIMQPTYDLNRDWDKYIKKNKYSECQLITALNAYYFLTGEHIEQNSKQYEKLVDLVSARHGSAINIEKLWKKLGLIVSKESNSLFEFIRTDISNGIKIPRMSLPLEYTIWHEEYGSHSTLIIDYDFRVKAVRILNFDKVTSLNGWLFEEDVHTYAKQCGEKPIFRLFELNRNQLQIK